MRKAVSDRQVDGLVCLSPLCPLSFRGRASW